MMSDPTPTVVLDARETAIVDEWTQHLAQSGARAAVGSRVYQWYFGKPVARIETDWAFYEPADG